MKLFHVFSKISLALGCFSLMSPLYGETDHSQPNSGKPRYPYVEARALPIEEMDMAILASTFGARYAGVMWRKQDYPSAVAQLDLSDTQKEQLIGFIRGSKVEGLTEALRTYSISRLYEHWGQEKLALKELESSSPSIHRVRLLLKTGDRPSAIAEAKRYFKLSKEGKMKPSYPTELSVANLTHPYVVVDDYRGMKEYLDLLAESAPDRQDIFFAQLDLAYHLGDLDNETARLKKEKPIHYILYLQYVERYADALEALILHLKHQPLSHSELVFLAPYFKNHKVIQKPIREMIASGEGGRALREELMIALSSRETRHLKEFLYLWLQTHPKEVDEWAIHFAFKILPQQRDDYRYGQLLEDLYQKLPDNPILGICVANQALIQPRRPTHTRSAHSITQILSNVVHDHMQRSPSHQALLPNWSTQPSNFSPNEKQLSEPVAMALAMLTPRLDANGLYHLLHEAPGFSKLPAAQKARYYAIARLDRLFLETMLTLDWSLPENDNRAQWLYDYFNALYYKDNIPASYLDQLAEKLPVIAMGSSEKYKRERRQYDFIPLLNLLLTKHPDPEKLEAPMKQLALAMKKNPDLHADVQFRMMQTQLVKNPMTANIFKPKKSASVKRDPRKDGVVDARRLSYAIVLFSAPDIMRLKSSRVNDWAVRAYSMHTLRRSKRYRSTIPIQYLKRRNVVYIRFWQPSEMEDLMRKSYPKFSEKALAYDLLNRLLQSEDDPKALYQYLDTLPKTDPDLILFKASIQIAHEASDDEVLTTLAGLKTAPATQRKRAMNLIQHYGRRSNSQRTFGDPRKWKMALGKKISQLIALEPPVGLVPNLVDEQKQEKNNTLAELNAAGDQLLKFRNEKKYQSEACQTLAKKILWDLANGDAETAKATHNHAMSAMMQVGTFKDFLKEVEADLKRRGLTELQQLRIIRRFYSYPHSKQKPTKLAYSKKIKQLAPDDLIAASDFLPTYIKERKGDDVLHCIKVIANQASDTAFLQTMKRNPSIFSTLNHDQVAEVLNTTLRDISWSKPLDFSEYFSSVLPKCYTKNKTATRDYLKWLKREDRTIFNVKLLVTLLQLGVRDLPAEVITEKLFSTGIYSRPLEDPLRFSNPKRQTIISDRSKDNRMYSLIIQYELAETILKLSHLKLEDIPVYFIRNRFIIEMLASPSIATYQRIAPFTVEKVAAHERYELCVEVRLLLNRISGSEPLQLFVSQAMLDRSRKLNPSEISIFFRLAYNSRDAKTVEDIWENIDLLAEKQKKKNGSFDYFLSINEFCILATLNDGNEKRWKKLVSVLSQENRYENKQYKQSFNSRVFKKLQEVLAYDLTSISPDRGQDLLDLSIHRISKIESWANRTPNWIGWTLLAARCGDELTLKYFYENSKQNILSKSSDSDSAIDALDFWISYLKGDSSVVHPVIHAYESDDQWNILWTLSGLPQRRDAEISPGAIIHHKTGATEATYSLTILAGPSPYRLNVIKTISKAPGSGSAPIQLPQDARWLGLLAKSDTGVAMRWATPIKLANASAPRVDIKTKITAPLPTGFSLEWADKEGPFNVAPAAHLNLPSAQQGEKHIKLFTLAWKPGESLFASAWIKQKNRQSASLSIGFYDDENHLLSNLDLKTTRSNYSPFLQMSMSTNYWAYASTPRKFTLPDRVDHAIFMVKTHSMYSRLPHPRSLDFADVRIKHDVQPKPPQ